MKSGCKLNSAWFQLPLMVLPNPPHTPYPEISGTFWKQVGRQFSERFNSSFPPKIFILQSQSVSSNIYIFIDSTKPVLSIGRRKD